MAIGAGARVADCLVADRAVAAEVGQRSGVMQLRDGDSTATVAVTAGATIKGDGAVTEGAVALIELRLNMMIRRVAVAIRADDIGRGGVCMTGTAQPGLSGL